MIAYFRYGFGGFQVYAAHVDDVWCERSRRFSDVMTVLEDNGRIDSWN